jgi:hypothetical protein
LSDLPAPLTPADCDLQGLEYMPLLGTRLFGSEFNARVTDAEWRAAITLWWAAWTQRPAASLPDDDISLCRLADLGRDLKAWRKVKSGALSGFVKCSDGRLYHPTVAEQAVIAWDKRVKERERKAQWRAKKLGHDADVPGTETGTGTGQERGRDADVPADVTRRDGTYTTPTPSPPASPCPPDVRKVIEAAGMSSPPSDAHLLREWLALPDMELDRDILPVIRRVADDVRGRTGRAPFKLKLFDEAVRRKHAEDEAAIAAMRRNRRLIEEQDAAQAAEREANAR